MKKKSILKFMFGTLLLGLLSLSSCKKCYTCTYSGYSSYDRDVCSSSFKNNDNFNDYVDDLEDAGYRCD